MKKSLYILLALFCSACTTVERCKMQTLPSEKQYERIADAIVQRHIDKNGFCEKQFQGDNVIFYRRDENGNCVLDGMK